MFGKAYDLSLLSQDAYNRYFDNNFHVTKRLNDGDMVFFDQPKQEPKTAKECDEQIAKSKLLSKYAGPFLLYGLIPTSSLSIRQGPSSLSLLTAAPKPPPEKTSNDPKIESERFQYSLPPSQTNL